VKLPGVRVRALIYTYLRGHPRRSLALLGACLLQLAALALAGAAHAEYGELGRIPFTAGKNSGQVYPNGEARSFAVDSSDGSFYVADEPENGEFRIQRFNKNGTFEASASFKPPEAKKVGAQGGVLGEGGMQIAVDPARNRIYALLLYQRRGSSEKEEEALEKEEKKLEKEGKQCGPGTCYARTPLDSEELTAGDLTGLNTRKAEESRNLSR